MRGACKAELLWRVHATTGAGHRLDAVAGVCNRLDGTIVVLLVID
jgi:hypothetical protein